MTERGTDCKPSDQPRRPDRRHFLTQVAALGVTAPLFGEALWAQAVAGEALTTQQLQAAEAIAGLEFSDAERQLMLAGLNNQRDAYLRLRQVPLANTVPPALTFFAQPLGGERRPLPPALPDAVTPAPATVPASTTDLAFLPVTVLSQLIQRREVSSEELTRLYLERLRRLDPQLHCLIHDTESRALAQARQADQEIAAGRYRGPLHGIPWGAKDLLAVAGTPTTWGAKPFEHQQLDYDAAVVRRLDAAGAVLIAKLSLGAIAWGDVWFGGQTLNPWNLSQGSSGSSAGSAAATAAGLVGFAVGSETWGSIVSPATRCGATGLRPTFGRVSRAGAMALSWSMDKLGPICRSAEDCALVFSSIHGRGPGEQDPATVDQPFDWNPRGDVRALRVGYAKELFELPVSEEDDDAEWRRFDLESLEVLRRLGIELIPFELPKLPVDSLSFILGAEAAAAFDELTRSGADDQMVRQVEQAWPNVWRQARMIPAVEYIQANRVRTLLMADMERRLTDLDAYVAPSFAGNNLLLTNLTGHPAVVVPNGFRADGTPTSISFIGRPFEEEKVLLLARAFQQVTDFHVRQPPLAA